MSEFPKMLYKAGGPHDIHGGKFDYRIVADGTELESMLAVGWHRTTQEALSALETEEQDNAAPTRAELEQKAAELNIKFDGRTSDKTLTKAIEAALVAQVL